MAEPSRSLSKAAEQVRQFNHSSRSAAKNWEFPSHSYYALGSLAHLVRLLPQALEQAVRPVTHTYEHGRVRIDNGGDADQAVRDLTQALTDALGNAEALATAVARMHAATSPMGLDTTGMPEFDEDGNS
jgi:hypothetical protein